MQQAGRLPLYSPEKVRSFVEEIVTIYGDEV
jgi:hypothetical protein